MLLAALRRHPFLALRRGRRGMGRLPPVEALFFCAAPNPRQGRVLAHVTEMMEVSGKSMDSRASMLSWKQTHQHCLPDLLGFHMFATLTPRTRQGKEKGAHRPLRVTRTQTKDARRAQPGSRADKVPFFYFPCPFFDRFLSHSSVGSRIPL